MLLATPIVLGIIVGIAVMLLAGRYELIIPGAIIGLVGAVILRFVVYALYDSHAHRALSFSWIGIVSSIIGAALAAYALTFLPRGRTSSS